MLVKYHSSDNIKAPFEDFALGLQNAWVGLTWYNFFLFWCLAALATKKQQSISASIS